MSTFKFACPHCDQHIQCETGYAGLEIACPVCTRHFIVPHPAGVPVAAMAAAPALATATAPTAALAAPPLLRVGQAAAPSAIAPPPTAPRAPVNPGLQRPMMKKARGNDGWAKDETTLNKMGMYLLAGGTVIAALLNCGVFGIEVPSIFLWIFVVICGVVSGIMNLMGGRGPIWAGILIGLTIAVGAFGALSLWIAFRGRVRGYECTIMFFLGAVPGGLLQKLLQKLTMGKA